MKNIVIIPARGGSKRLKNKNIRPLLGIPLIGHSILEALKHHDIDDIFVSSDCEKIKTESLKFGAKTIHRPGELSGDTATTLSAIQHAVDFLNLPNKDNIIILQPTNPIRPKNLIRECLSLFTEKKLNSLFSVSENLHKLGEIQKNHFIPLNYEFGQRSQDMKKFYYENGLIYITKVSLIKKGIIFNHESYPFCVEKTFPIIDIDYLEDFHYAEFILNQRHDK